MTITDRTENTWVSLNITREQSTNHMEAHTFIELKNKTKTMKVKKLWDFDRVLRIVLWRQKGVCFGFLVSLMNCFDYFIGVYDYSVGRSMFSRNHRKSSADHGRHLEHRKIHEQKP